MDSKNMPRSMGEFLDLYVGEEVQLGVSGFNESGSIYNVGRCKIVSTSEKEVLVQLDQVRKLGELNMRASGIVAFMTQEDGTALIAFRKSDVDTLRGLPDGVKISRH